MITADYSALAERIVGRRICKTAARRTTSNSTPKRENVCGKCGGELYQRNDDKEETVVNGLKNTTKKRLR